MPTRSPVYRDEGNEEEIVQEDGVELSLSHLEEELAVEDEGEESDGDAPIYLDLSAIQQGRDENVRQRGDVEWMGRFNNHSHMTIVCISYHVT